jgi:hypothetical protein
MVLFSVDSSNNNAHLNDEYNKIISGKNKSEITAEKVKNLVFGLLDLHFN